MAKTNMSIRMDDWITKELSELSKVRGIAPSALIREFVISGLGKQDSMVEHFDSESVRVDKQLKLITDTVLGSLYYMVAYRNLDAESNPSSDKTKEIIDLGMKISQELLEIRA
ncbi:MULTISPECIES: hypothetical protein [unclassified Polynucleobacter]|uniref:hypothetical protein n=1 Tax=unclassified Polynucleobacter TaxID=2640945 RepID=UPI001C0BEBC7|nr:MULTISPECIES: hypothetical protein [unclassified Polynucleobacter]MBU3562649.1 hypothetical protein [Polynucleobacter sp. Tro8-14-1]MBU3624523.1 hypothetical protein [Polynucleobacter sp. AP-Latsch-80-C2]